MSGNPRDLPPGDLSRDPSRDAGLGLALGALVAGRLGGWPRLIDLSMALLFLAIAAPGVLRPVARAWRKLLRAFGVAVETALLGLLFFLMVVPIGLARRISGADELQLRKWRDGSPSAFTTRGGAFEAGDIEAPY
jgi:hypothetical protein